MSRHRLTWLDVFTSEPLTGNGLAVVHDADAVEDATMLRVARETRLSETTFLQSATAPGADYRNRIWMMTGELPFAGHPSLGTAVAMALAREEPSARYVQQTAAGLQPLEVELAADRQRAKASMLQEPAVFGAELDPSQALAALGLPHDLADPTLPAQVVSTGVPQVVLCVDDASALADVRPDYAVIAGLLEPHGAVVLYLAHVDVDSGSATARGFVGSAEVGEDPATGSAAGPLCAHVAARTGQDRLEIVQGVEMGRRSVLRCSLEGERVRVGGDTVVLFEATLNLDT